MLYCIEYCFYIVYYVFSGRACGNIGLSHESLQNFKEAISYQEQHLSIAAQNNDKTAKTLAYSSLGMYSRDIVESNLTRAD